MRGEGVQRRSGSPWSFAAFSPSAWSTHFERWFRGSWGVLMFLFGRRTLDILSLWGKLAPCCFARIKGLASRTIEETSQELPFSLDSWKIHQSTGFLESFGRRASLWNNRVPIASHQGVFTAASSPTCIWMPTFCYPHPREHSGAARAAEGGPRAHGFLSTEVRQFRTGIPSQVQSKEPQDRKCDDDTELPPRSFLLFCSLVSDLQLWPPENWA